MKVLGKQKQNSEECLLRMRMIWFPYVCTQMCVCVCFYMHINIHMHTLSAHTKILSEY